MATCLQSQHSRQTQEPPNKMADKTGQIHKLWISREILTLYWRWRETEETLHQPLASTRIHPHMLCIYTVRTHTCTHTWTHREKESKRSRESFLFTFSNAIFIFEFIHLFFEIRSHYVTQANLELLIFLLQPPKSQGFSYTSHGSFLSFSLKLEPEV